MRILILNWRDPKHPQAGGAEIVTLEHAKAWVKARHRVVWCAGGFGNAPMEEVVDGLRIYRFGRPSYFFLLAPLVYWFKFKGDFDLVVDEIHGLPFLSPLWASRSKKLAFIHEVAQEIWDKMFPFPFNRLGKLSEKVLFKFYQGTPFLTVSPSTVSDLTKFGIPPKNIAVITNGITLKPVNGILKKEENLTLLFVSRLVKMKGIEDALRVFSLVKEKVPDAKFWVVGSGQQRYLNHLKKLSHELGVADSVHFFGFVPEEEKIRLYQQAHFLIHTSIREGFGLVVIEANSQGTPAIVYASPGLKDIVVDGVNGYQVHQGDIERLTNRLVGLYQDEKSYHRLVVSGLKYSRQFDWERITQRSVELVEGLVVGGNKAKLIA